LAGIDAEEDQSSPLDIANQEETLDLRDGKRTTFALASALQGIHRGRWV
jgi:hypothetical protein